MNTRSVQSARLPRGAMLLMALVLAALGLAVQTATASADFTLSSGTLSLTDGDNSSPPNGSWVELPQDPPATGFFVNTTSTWTGGTGQYTLIKNANSDTSTTALELGGTQSSSGEIFGDTTDQFAGTPFYAITTNDPTLTFSGTASDTGTRTLVSGDLSGFEIVYNGVTYDVGTTEATGGDHVVPLHGEIIGAVGGKTPPTITLDWTTDLTKNAGNFSPFQAHFHLEGDYTP